MKQIAFNVEFKITAKENTKLCRKVSGQYDWTRIKNIVKEAGTVAEVIDVMLYRDNMETDYVKVTVVASEIHEVVYFFYSLGHVGIYVEEIKF